MFEAGASFIENVRGACTLYTAKGRVGVGAGGVTPYATDGATHPARDSGCDPGKILKIYIRICKL